MKILVTGSKGFVGSHLILELRKRKNEVIEVDKKEGLNINEKRMDDLIKNLDGRLDMIVHLAANCSTSKSINNPKGDFDDNVRATFKMCELARETNSPIIFISSCKVHPNKRGERTPYGLSKYIGEMYLKEYQRIYGVRFIINRPGTIYGPGQKGSPESGWFSWFIKAEKENHPITIYGDGNQSRDVLFIDDFIRLLTDQINNFSDYERQKSYEVGGGLENEITLLEALKFLNYSNYHFDKPRQGDVKRFVSDNIDISNVNQWKPLISWKKGLEKTLNSLK